MSAQPDTRAAEPAARSTWDKLLTTTPVIMTVVATILAGLSNSEMIKAQYYRSLAAQAQAKVGDQWAFFQFKRARGTSHDMTIKLLQSLGSGVEFTPESLRAQAVRLERTLKQGAAEAEHLRASVKAAQIALGPHYPLVQQAAEELYSRGAAELARAERGLAALNAALADAEVTKALASCNGSTSKASNSNGATDPIADDDVRALLQEIAQRKTERETEGLVAQIQQAHVDEAILALETKAQAADAANKPVVQALDRLEQLVAQASAGARSWERSVAAFRTAVDELPTRTTPPASAWAIAAATLELRAAALKRATHETSAAFTGERLRSEERRYQREAEGNRVTAGLYEINVRKSGWHSERHRRRSGYFFYGMLAAQAGVTIASLALAVRMKSVMWSVASVAGTVAVAIGAYVYLYV